MAAILVLHPGDMGSALAECLVTAGHEARWLRPDRSQATRERADAAGLVAFDDLSAALDGVDAVLSICPPDAAIDVAKTVAAAATARTDGPTDRVLYIDANAIAPVTMTEVAKVATEAGFEPVDGGVIGPPPREAGRTRLCLSGPAAADVAAWWADTMTETVVLGPEMGQASALKMLYASWTKQSAALLLLISAGAEAYGVHGALEAEWARSQPDLARRVPWAAAQAGPKAWRWRGEMEEIAATFAQQGLPAGISLGAAEVFRRLESHKDDDPPAELSALIASLLDP